MDGTVSSQTLTIHLRRFLNKVRPTKETKTNKFSWIFKIPRIPYARTSKCMDGTLHPFNFMKFLIKKDPRSTLWVDFVDFLFKSSRQNLSLYQVKFVFQPNGSCSLCYSNMVIFFHKIENFCLFHLSQNKQDRRYSDPKARNG